MLGLTAHGSHLSALSDKGGGFQSSCWRISPEGSTKHGKTVEENGFQIEKDVRMGVTRGKVDQFHWERNARYTRRTRRARRGSKETGCTNGGSR